MVNVFFYLRGNSDLVIIYNSMSKLSYTVLTIICSTRLGAILVHVWLPANSDGVTSQPVHMYSNIIKGR